MPRRSARAVSRRTSTPTHPAKARGGPHDEPAADRMDRRSRRARRPGAVPRPARGPGVKADPPARVPVTGRPVTPHPVTRRRAADDGARATGVPSGIEGGKAGRLDPSRRRRATACEGADHRRRIGAFTGSPAMTPSVRIALLCAGLFAAPSIGALAQTGPFQEVPPLAQRPFAPGSPAGPAIDRGASGPCRGGVEPDRLRDRAFRERRLPERGVLRAGFRADPRRALLFPAIAASSATTVRTRCARASSRAVGAGLRTQPMPRRNREHQAESDSRHDVRAEAPSTAFRRTRLDRGARCVRVFAPCKLLRRFRNNASPISSSRRPPSGGA